MWITIFYACFATLSIYYGLVVCRSLIITLVLFHLMTCTAIPLFHRMAEGNFSRHWHSLWHSPLRPKSELMLTALGSGILFMLVISTGMSLLLPYFDVMLIRRTLTDWGLESQWLWLFVIYISVINSLLEEFFWRGFVLAQLLGQMPRRMALVVSSFLYSLYHVIIFTLLLNGKWAVVLTGLVFLAGLFWSWLKIRDQVLYGAWLSHFFADVGLMIVLVSQIF